MLQTDYLRRLMESEKFKKRFWKKVRKTSGCWIWRAGKRRGYGIIGIKDHVVTAHRASWIIHKGGDPSGLIVCHKCDVPTCVNPEHLFLGTALDNMWDCIEKGRSWHARMPRVQETAGAFCSKGCGRVRGPSGRYCRECRAAYMREWRKKRCGRCQRDPSVPLQLPAPREAR